LDAAAFVPRIALPNRIGVSAFIRCIPLEAANRDHVAPITRPF
jgi:hypothetical protein